MEILLVVGALARQVVIDVLGRQAAGKHRRVPRGIEGAGRIEVRAGALDGRALQPGDPAVFELVLRAIFERVACRAQPF